MTLNGVPWREALDVIVRATGYAWIEQEYQIIRVVSQDKLEKDLRTKIFHLNYTNAKEMSAVVAGSMSKDGKVITDARSNSLIITDTPVSLDAVTRIINTLDGRTREVQLELKFVEFSNSDAQKIGFDPINTSFNLKGIGTVAPSFQPFNDIFGGGVNFNTTNPSPASSGDFSATFAFEALTTLSSSEVLQAPQVLTLDNTKAVIRIGREIHYAETTITQNPNGSGSLVTLKEASSSPVKDGITIELTPHITSDGFVSIELKAINDKVDLIQFTNGQSPNSPDFAAIELPTKNTTELNTTIMIADGKTGVIGGILTNQSREETRQIPLLGSLPGLGWLFKKRNESIEQRNLTVFVTPRIIPTSDKSEYEESRLRLRERLSGLDLRPKVENDPNSRSLSEP
jgi:type IV pilus assembly protein PilQ